MIRNPLLYICVAFALWSRPHPLHAQMVSGMVDESKFYAESKQVNQFFRRFNGEEDEKGNRYYPGDKQFRSAKLRKKYLGVLFDESNPGLTLALKTQFAKDILDKPNTFLDFHATGWFAEVQVSFAANGKERPAVLFLELENDHQGSKWVINKAHVDAYEIYFARDTTKIGQFIHPMSHELDFMNLHKAFTNSDSISQFTIKKFVPDHLSVLLVDIKRGNMKFKSVESLKFHFFQVNGWYFELTEFNRPGYNTGWLISNLVRLNSESEKELIRKHVSYETQ